MREMAQDHLSYENVLESALNCAMTQLQHFGQEELRSFLQDESKIDSLIENLPQVRSLPTEREMTLTQNKSLAEWNLSLEPRLNEAKNRLRKTYETATELKKSVHSLKGKLEVASKQCSLDSTHAILQAAVQTAEDESEAIAGRFLDGQIDYSQFLAEFPPKRRLAHMRKVKSEKLTEILSSQQFPTRIPTDSNPYNSKSGFWAYPSASKSPYPM